MARATFTVWHNVQTPYAVERGVATVMPDLLSGSYTIVASAHVGRDPQRQGIARVVAVTLKDEAGFRGRQWQTSEHGTGRAIGEGQHRTLREAAQETIMLAVQRAEANRLMRLTINEEPTSSDDQDDVPLGVTHPHPIDGTHEGLARDCGSCEEERGDAAFDREVRRFNDYDDGIVADDDH